LEAYSVSLWRRSLPGRVASVLAAGNSAAKRIIEISRALPASNVKMLSIERILCPVDFSECSARAYDYAHSLARHYGAKLFVQHVAVPLDALYAGYMNHMDHGLIQQVFDQQEANAEENFRELARNVADGVEQDFAFERGSPAADLILLFAASHEIDLIVMGTHGRRGLDRLMMGSVVERVLRKARSPVLAVRTSHAAAPKGGEHDVELRRILFCTDFSEDSPRALEYALSFAMQYGSELSVLHVLEGTRNEREIEQQKQNALASLQQTLPEEAAQWASISTLVRVGRAYEEIITYAAEMKTDLIVMGVRGRNLVDLALFGSTTHRVVQLSPCPVLVVRT
jgi:nucleotide-binding universal stress UspA family protein